MWDPSIQAIGRHRFLRRLRAGAKADLVLSVIFGGAILTGLALVGAAALYVLPETQAESLLEHLISEVGPKYTLAIVFAALLANILLSAGHSISLSAYTHYPVSLRSLALLVQVLRALSVRCFVIGFVVNGMMFVLYDELTLVSIFVAAFFVIGLDSGTILARSLEVRAPCAFHCSIVAGFGLVVMDALWRHTASGLLFGVLSSMGPGLHSETLILIAISLTLGMYANYGICRELRFVDE